MQEARVTGLLNHPNILDIYDIGTCEGISYIVCELLEGKTLHDVMAGKILPVSKAINYAFQIANGLAAAHAKGVVHRDLKPENLFLTRDGRVKLLDFGLAKLVDRELASAINSASTMSVDTEPGVLLGTASYMSPEQVRGRVVDARSDIFNLGTILYEMLAGRQLFSATHQ